MIGWIVLGVLALFVGTLVVRAALFRARRAGESVPPTLSNLVLNEPQEEDEVAEAEGTSKG